MMRRAAGFQADQAGRNLVKRLESLLAAQLSFDDDLAIAIDAMDRKTFLARSTLRGANLHVDALVK